MNIISFFAQCLLCVIFWQLGTKVEVDETDGETSYGEVQVEEFDEEAELQARIWNGFTRAIHGVTDSVRESFTATVTPQQITDLSYRERPRLAQSSNTHRPQIQDLEDV